MELSDREKSSVILEAVIEATADAISVADENGNTVIVNPAYTRITGLPREAVINKPVTVDIAEGESMHLQVLKTGRGVRNVRMKVGPAKRDVIVNVAPIFVDGTIRGSVGIIHDISEMISLTAELDQARKLIRQLKANYTWEDIIGGSPQLQLAKEQAKRAAETPATVLLRGESGTGKELFAHAIHNASRRRKGQFVRVNCAAISENLLESELFGYEEGAFTGALKGGKKGYFEEADGGTIFLDEIGEISPAIQAKLLRVIQEREIIRVGGTKPMKVDVRVIAATNADLEQKIRTHGFREDLYYRLNVMPIQIPPLRDHRGDIRPLAGHILLRLNQEFGREVQRISDSAIEDLMQYGWPGNIRELENVLGRAMISMRPQETVLDLQHLPLMPCEKSYMPAAGSLRTGTLEQAVAEAERSALERALQETGGSRTKAASLLGISMRSFFYKMGRYGLK